MKGRLLILSISFVCLYMALIFNVYNLQLSDGTTYSAKAASQNRLSHLLEARRGNIYFTDKSGNSVPVAINKEFPSIFAVPKEVSDPGYYADKLASILSLDRTKLFNSFIKENDPYEPILKKADISQIDLIKQESLKGIYIENDNVRFYPFGKLAANVLGFVAPSLDNSSLSGKYGIEFLFNKELSGKKGEVKGDVVNNSEPGEDIHLTLDPSIQTKAEEILSRIVEQYKASGGTVIVQDPKTGKILAMGSVPNFDPNEYSKFELKDFDNSAVQALYEPGSVVKVITMAAGINNKKFTPDTTFVDKGSVTLNSKTIKNHGDKIYGKVTMTEIIEKSINTGAVYAGKLVGKDLFYNYLVKFGFNNKTGIELPGEVNGNIRKLKTSFKDIDFATASFGQGIAVTPIQLIGAISAIANGGTLMKPYILSDTEPQEVRNVITKETSEEVVKMMIAAVDKGQVAKIPNYYVAGKTGTAYVPDLKNGGYKEEFVHSFVGFTPALNPRFTILYKLDSPKNVDVAAATVAPAFKELAEFLINYYNIPPDYITN